MEQEGGWVSSQHSMVWRRVKALCSGWAEEVVFLPSWGFEVGDQFWIQGFRVPGMALVSQLLGWEAALAWQHCPVSVQTCLWHCRKLLSLPRAGEAAPCTEPVGTGSKHSALCCAEVSQIFPFLSFLKSCVVSSLLFLPLAHPEAAAILERAESCRQPGCLSQGQVSSAAVLTPLSTLSSPFSGSVHLAVPAANIFDSCWLCFHCLQGLACITLTAIHANLLLFGGSWKKSCPAF